MRTTGDLTPARAETAAARHVLRQEQAVWGRQLGYVHRGETTALTHERADETYTAATRDGDFIRHGAFRYEVRKELARRALTSRIIDRIQPGPYEDPNYLFMIARQAASVEYILSDENEAARPAPLERILLGTTGEPRGEGVSIPVGNTAVILMSAGLMTFLYQASKAVVLSWKPGKPPKGSLVSFSGGREDVDEVLARDPFPVELFSRTLETWLYEGSARPPGSEAPAVEYTVPLALLINNAERFVLAHEYGHALMDQLDLGNDSPFRSMAPPANGPVEEELRADAFAFVVLVESAMRLDRVSANVALQGAIVAMKALQLWDRVLAIARHGVAHPDVDSDSHPAFHRRIAQLEAFYVNGHPDKAASANALVPMQIPSQTMEQLWARAEPRFKRQFRDGRRPHAIWHSEDR